MKSKSQKIGLPITTSLVVGNMIGAGIFVLPVYVMMIWNKRKK